MPPTASKRISYPRIDLRIAVQKAEQIRNEIGRSRRDREQLAEAMGYSTLSGTAIRTIAALNLYGLIQPVEGKDWKLSSLAIRILDSDSDDERLPRLRRAALTPEIFNDLYKNFGDVSTKSKVDEATTYLRESGFESEISIKNTLRVFSNALRFADMIRTPQMAKRRILRESLPSDETNDPSLNDVTMPVDFKDWQRLQVGSDFTFKIMTLNGIKPNASELEDLVDMLNITLRRMKSD